MGFMKPFKIMDENMAQVCPLLNVNELLIWDTAKSYVKAFNGSHLKFHNFKDYNKILFIPEMDTTTVTDFSRCFYECNKLITIPELDTSNGTDFSEMFSHCTSLIKIPPLDTSKGVNFGGMFGFCSSLEDIPTLNTENGTKFDYMFAYCRKLKSVLLTSTAHGTDFCHMFRQCYSLTEIPTLDTSNNTNFESMFSECSSLTTIPLLDASNGTDFYGMFYGCQNLITITKIIFNSALTSSMSLMFNLCDSLENINIEGTIKVNSNNLNLSFCPNLTVDSLMSFINAFEDNTGEETQYTVTIGAVNLAKLTPEQIAVATNKNILLA